MGDPAPAQVENGGSSPYEPPLPGYVDWIAAVIIALGGLFLTVGGTILYFVVDRNLLQDGIESGEITVVFVHRELTRAEMLSFVTDVVDWTGLGLLVTGIAMVLFAVAYAITRYRTHRGSADASGSRWRYAVIGATASAVLSFVPFSPILGGGLAGYFAIQDTEHSTSTGAVSGLLYSLPGLSILIFVTFGLYSGLAGVGEPSLGYVIIPAMLVVFVFVTVYGAGLGALGGFVGGRLAAGDD